MTRIRSYRRIIAQSMMSLMVLWQLEQPLQAATFYWDINNTVVGAGGAFPSGTWDGVNTFFNTDSTGAGGGSFAAVTTTADTVTFAAGTDARGSYTVTVGGTQNVGGLTFEDGVVTVSSGTLNFGAVNGALVVSGAAGRTATINSLLTGSAGFTKSGSGTLVLGGANTGLTGTVSISGGALSFSASSNLGDAAAGNTLAVSNNATLLFTSGTAVDLTSSRSLAIGTGGASLGVSGAGVLTVSGVVSGGASDALTKTGLGAGALILTAANTYQGVTRVRDGTLQMNGNTGDISSSGGLTFTGTSTFRYDNTGAAGTISDTIGGALTFSAGEGILLSNRTAAQSTNLTFSSLATRAAGATGVISTAGTGSSASVNKTIFTSAPATAQFLDQGLFFNDGATATNNGYAVYDATGFVRAMIYTGTPDANTFQSAGGATLGAATDKHVNLITAAVTAQTTDSIRTLRITGAFNVTQTSGTTLTLTEGGLLKIGNTAATISGGTLDATTKEFVIRVEQNTLTVSSLIAGSAGLTKSGAGTLLISGHNTGLSGGVIVNAGVLTANGTTPATGAPTTNPFGSSSNSITLNNGTTLNLRDNADGTTTGLTMNYDNSIIVNGSATLTTGRIGGTGTGHTFRLGSLTLGEGTLTVTQSNTYSTSFNSTTTLNGNATINSSANSLTLVGVISDGGNGYSLTKTGAGNLFLNGANTFTGGIFHTAAILVGNGATAFGTNNVYQSSTGNIQLRNASAAANSPIFVSGDNLNLQLRNNAATTFTGAGLTFAATGVTQYGFNSSRTSGSGTNLTHTFSGPIVTQSNMQFNFAGGAASFDVNLGGAITLGGNLTLNNADAVGTQDGTISGVINDGANAFTLTKIGLGLVTLSAANTFDGQVSVLNGVLQFNNAGAGGTHGTVLVGDTSGSNIATLQLGPATGGVTLASSVTVQAGSSGVKTLGGANISGTSTFSGVISMADALSLSAASGIGTVGVTIFGQSISDGAGSFALTKAGTGIVVLLGNQAHDGGTTVTGGYLALAGTGYTGITLNGGGIVTVGSGSYSGAVTIGTGGGSFLYTSTAPDITAASYLTLTGTSGTITADTNGFNVTYANALGNSNTGGFTKVGAGTLTLIGASGGSTYGGTTTVGAGTLTLDFAGASAPTSNIIKNTSVLDLQGGTLNLNGVSGGTLSQTFASSTLTAGGSTVSNALNSATSVTANLGVINSRAAGSALHFAIPASTAVNVSTTAANTAGILGGWATYGTSAGVATDWAAVDGAGNVIPLASYTALDALGGGTATTSNFTMGANVTLSGGANITANTLRISAASTLALGTFTASFGGATGGVSSGSGSGGILYSATTGTGTISGTTTTTSTGFISGPAAGELPVFVSTGGTLTISAGVGGVTANFGVTKSGGGTLTLTNAGTTVNNFTGQLIINGGTVSINALSVIGNASGVTLDGGILNQTVNFSMDRAITLGLNGGTLNYNSTAGSGGWSSTSAIAFIGSGSRTLTLGGTVSGRVATLSAALGESGGPTSLAITGGSDTSIFQLSATNSYTGTTTINRGILRLNATNALPVSSNVIFNGGANRAILEFTSTGGTTFTNALGTLPGQVQWVTNANGGFSSASAGTTLTVNLGGQISPATVVWGTGGFVNGTGVLQFAQAAANSNFGSGTVDFQNPIDLNGGTRTIDVADNGSQLEAILSGAISSSSAGGVLNKTGAGNLRLNGDSSSSTDTTIITVASYLIFGSTSAVPGASGAVVTVNSGSAIVLAGSTDPLTAIGSRIVTTSAGSIALDVDSSVNLDFSSFSALSLGAYNSTMGQPVIYTGIITPNGTTYRIAPGRGGAVNTAVVTGNTLVNMAANAAQTFSSCPEPTLSWTVVEHAPWYSGPVPPT